MSNVPKHAIVEHMRRHEKQRVVPAVLITLTLVFVLGIGLTNLSQVREFFSHASGYPASIQVDTQTVVGQLPRPWRNLAQGGESHAWRIAPIESQIAALHPEYVRLDHIYDFYDVVSGSPGNLSFNFEKLDLVLEDIRSVGAVPFISLSYTPMPLAPEGDLTGKPLSYQDWQLVVQRTIEHISGQKGFTDVYYEVWNEPDLFGNWMYYGEKNYLDLYAAAAHGAAAAQNVLPFKFGGPATTGLYKNWMDAVLTQAQEQNLRLDFISWHLYSSDLEKFRTDMSLARDIVSQYPKLNGVVEYLITEWGHTSVNDVGYDNALSAAHTVAGSINMVGVIERGFIFEIQDGADPNGKSFWGRWGLLTSPESGAQSKPRYNALKLLDQLADQRLQLSGQGSFVKALAAKDLDGSVQVVLANFDPQGRNRETVPVLFAQVEPGNYQLTGQYLSGQQITQQLATSAAQLQTTLPLGPNDVAYVKLAKTQN